LADQQFGLCRRLFSSDFDEDAVGEFAFEQVDYAAFDVAFENLWVD
jgi:hypothetical protein